MHRIALLALPAVLVACNGKETSFSNTGGDDNLGGGTPEVVLSSDVVEIVIPDTESNPFQPGVSYSAPFSIGNAGDGVLQVYNLDMADSGDGMLGMDELEDTSIAPGQDKEVLIVATLPEAGEARGLIRIKTNAPDWTDERIEIVACVEGYCTGGDDGGDEGGTGGDDGGTGGTGGDDGSTGGGS